MRVSTERLLRGLLLVLLGALAWTIADTLRERSVNVGDRVPSFTLTADDGRTVRPADFQGKVLVLNFWATWCPPCLEELPSLNQFSREMRAQGVEVLGVSVDHNEQEYKQFLQRFPVAFRTARDPGGSIAGEYGTTKYPETYIIGRDGRVVEKVISSQDWMRPEIVSRVRSLL